VNKCSKFVKKKKKKKKKGIDNRKEKEKGRREVITVVEVRRGAVAVSYHH